MNGRHNKSCKVIEETLSRFFIEEIGVGDSGNLLIKGDCKEFLALLHLPLKSAVGCVICDPPYNSKQDFGTYSDRVSHKKYAEFAEYVARICHGLLKPSGFYLHFGDDSEIHYIKVILDDIFGRSNYITTSYIWTRYSNRSPVRRKDIRYKREIEHLLVYRKSDAAEVYVSGAGSIPHLVDGAELGERDHEGAGRFPGGKKPEELIRQLLALYTTPHALVLDCFLGSGTTAAVAHKMGRSWIGVEIGEHCLGLVRDRLRDVVSGVDQAGISQLVRWQGGGGFSIYDISRTSV